VRLPTGPTAGGSCVERRVKLVRLGPHSRATTVARQAPYDGRRFGRAIVNPMLVASPQLCGAYLAVVTALERGREGQA
jgi:hypothetical protein